MEPTSTHSDSCLWNARTAIQENNLTIEDEADHAPESDAVEWLCNGNVPCVCA